MHVKRRNKGNCIKKATVSAKVWIISMVIAASAFAGESFTALSMLTHDGRRMISRRKGGKTVYELTRAHHNGTTLTLGTPFRRSLLPASLSGISWAVDNAYYAVSDDVFTGEVGLYPMTIELATNGLSVISCSIPSPTNRISLAKAYDLEDVAFDAVNGTVWVADETRGTVKEYRVADGTVVRTLSLPEELKKTRSNLGIESLTLSPDGKTLWTCTEEALACDGARSSPTNGTTVRLLKYTRPTAKEGFTLAGTYSYTTDVWSQRFDYGGKGRRGVSGLCALPDGSLLVLERELSFGGAHPLKAAATARLSFDVYHVEFPRGGGALGAANGRRDLLAANVKKVKLASGGGPVFAFGNYEGICLGPSLPDGNRSVLLISDAGDGVSQPMILPMVLSIAGGPHTHVSRLSSHVAPQHHPYPRAPCAKLQLPKIAACFGRGNVVSLPPMTRLEWQIPRSGEAEGRTLFRRDGIASCGRIIAVSNYEEVLNG